MQSAGLRLTVIGIGYLGLTHAVCLAEMGHDVLAIDVDEERLAMVSQGAAPFYEPDLEPLLRKHLESGRLRFTTSFGAVGDFGDLHFLCVGTPQGPDGGADLAFVFAATRALAPHLARPCLIVGKSTVPPGTALEVRALARALAPAADAVHVAWNPEFLREGFAVQDSLRPDRLVFGVTSEAAHELLRRVYAAPLAAGVPGLCMDLETAELVKLSANAFLATKISFINAMAEVCETLGADVVQLAEALALDKRIGGRFLSPGLGFGGGCLPKDIRAFAATAGQLGVRSVADLLGTVDAINLGRRSKVADLARQAAGGTLAGKQVTVLGLAFKPDSDDIRDSPSLDICRRLAAEGAIVSAHDPAAMPNAARVIPDVRYADSVAAAAVGADVVLHLTEWAAYRAVDPAVLGNVVRSRIVIDARSVLDRAMWREAGWDVWVLGRPASPAVHSAAGTAGPQDAGLSPDMAV